MSQSKAGFKTDICNGHTKFAVHVTLSPVIQTPELLSTIFLLCLPEDIPKQAYSSDWSLNASCHRNYPEPSGREAPLLLAHVCQHWRAVALDTPQLWARVHLKFTRNVSEKLHLLTRKLDALSFWLNHSRSLPISVHLSRDASANFRICASNTLAERQSVPAPVKTILDMMDILYQHRHRWEHIRIDMPTSVITPFYESLNHDCPRLKSFELIQSHREGRSVQKRDIRIRSAPHLEDLVLPGLCELDSVLIPSGLPSSLQTLELRFLSVHLTQRASGTQIRELVLDRVHMSDDDFSHFPDAFPLLESLTASYIVPTTSHDLEDDESTCQVLDNLTRFRLRSKGKCFPLNLMIAPALKELSVTNEIKIRDSDFDNFNYEVYWLLKRSNASVERFMYSNGQPLMFGPGVSDILKAMPDVQELEMQNPRMSSSTVLLLESASICPRLTSIRSAGELIPMKARTRVKSAKLRDEPNALNLLTLIAERCCKKDGRPFGGFTYSKTGSQDRVWVKKLAFPLHKKDEDILRADEFLRGADVQFTNTHVCDCN